MSDSGNGEVRGSVSPPVSPGVLASPAHRIPRTTLGRTQLEVSRIAFGAGPVSGLMTATDQDLQSSVLHAAVISGVNWIDTAPGYGNGQSEASLGAALRRLDAPLRDSVHVATKFRFDVNSPVRLRDQLRTSLEQSLQRLQRSSVTLLQLHNGLTDRRNDEPSSITVDDCLKAGGIAEEFHRLREEGLCQFLGLTGTGTPGAMRTVIRAGAFDTVQVPYNVLNPSAGRIMSADFSDRDYGNILEDCSRLNLGAFAIRVFAAGAIPGNPPGDHTQRTPYFPLDLYHRDALKAAVWRGQRSPAEAARDAIRFSLEHPAVHAVIAGFASVAEVTDAVAAVSAGWH